MNRLATTNDITEVTRLNNATYIARPAGRCGNVGYSPFPWTAAYGRTEGVARHNFETKHWDYLHPGLTQ